MTPNWLKTAFVYDTDTCNEWCYYVSFISYNLCDFTANSKQKLFYCAKSCTSVEHSLIIRSFIKLLTECFLVSNSVLKLYMWGGERGCLWGSFH